MGLCWLGQHNQLIGGLLCSQGIGIGEGAENELKAVRRGRGEEGGREGGEGRREGERERLSEGGRERGREVRVRERESVVGWWDRGMGGGEVGMEV